MATKRKSPTIRPIPPPAGQSTDSQAAEGIQRHLPSSAAMRETIESVVIAFVLAFLFRTFEAEAFVIPTGSMAPTLMGRHKDLECPVCGFPYQVSASEEVDSDGHLRDRGWSTVAGTCPMCRYAADLAPGNAQRTSYSSFNGDRILVSKFAYQLADPKRWDVIVFKFPGDRTTDATTNFIKRLAGLPGETVRIQNGDLWVSRDGESFEIARKPADKLLAVLQPVFDNDYMPKIAERGWPERWQPEQRTDAATEGQWTSEDKTTFRTDGTGSGEHWLRYRHLVPSFQQWQYEQRGADASVKLLPQLITDFTAYNTLCPARANSLRPEAESLGVHWVGDLAVACTANVESKQGSLGFELRKGGRTFLCRIDVATGEAALAISGPGMESFRPTAATKVRGPGRYDILFANCDNELQLLVNGSPVHFETSAYADLGNVQPDATDLAPVGIASAGAAVQISHVRVLRDLYYSAVRGEGMPTDDRDVRYAAGRALPGEEASVPPSPHYLDFKLGPDQFFALGDNSAKSKDSRLWGRDNYCVPRELLIGKALYIYWPHSWDKLPFVGVPFPYFPNVARMGFVR